MTIPSVEKLYSEWILKKLKTENIKQQTKDRNDRLYKRCLFEFGKRKIKSITEYDIEDFLLDTIHDLKLTQKEYSNLRTIIYGIFKLAKKKRYIDYSITYVIGDMDISRKSFTKYKKTDYELAYPNDERIRYMDYLKNNLDDPRNAALLLCFVSGLRPGELVALKHENIDTKNNIIQVRQAEQKHKDGHGKYVYFVGNCKTENSVRDVYINEKYNYLLKHIKRLSPFTEYVFWWNGKRMREHNLNTKNATNCKKLGLIIRSVSKIRKTYASWLQSNGFDEKFIQAQMGHSEYMTTQKYYIKDIHTHEEKLQLINRVAM